MTDQDRQEYELVKAQVSLMLKHSKTEFWKVGVVTLAAGAIAGSLFVKLIGG
ncbi:hypothetical protein O4G76_18980 [Limimaricola sp. G21655-S1]|uniref:hypothetical protein n=1 Tax=Limimaricola sp. G21655-S1 TaxID=3014768 RepID=UPI0022B021B1|nr:hypothetical protein [Limimaricola sp. G21655-S1]MCZ4262917.1 hypothetical protein [Limimaricola sp. G21655-S1]